MATTIAKYKFDREDLYRAAIESIEKQVGSYSYNGWNYDSSNYIISIDDTCEKSSLIGKICGSFEGKPYSY